MYYAKPVEMVFDIVSLDYDYDNNNLYSHDGPLPKWIMDALVTKEEVNKLVVEDMPENFCFSNLKVLVLYGKYGAQSKSKFPVYVSYNPIFGIEFVYANPDNSSKGDWKRVCGIQNNPFAEL